MLRLNRCYCADALSGLKQLETGSVNCCVTSPPYYGLRDYGIDGQIGLESTPEEYISRTVSVFREVWRVLHDDGTLWLNMGDTYAGSGMGAANYPNKTGEKQTTNKGSMSTTGRAGLRFDGIKTKDLMGMPWMLAFALRADGWYLREDIIWNKPNPMPESVRDRCTKAHEYFFLLSKSTHYYFDADAIKEPCVQNEMANGFRGGAYCNNKTFDNSAGGNRENHGNVKPKRYGGKKYTENSDVFFRTKSGSIYEFTGNRNKRDVWTVSPAHFKEAHFATFPPELIKPCILAGCPKGGTVLDPFMGSGTTLVTANELDRNCIGFDLNPDYCNMANRRRENAMAQQSLFRNII